MRAVFRVDASLQIGTGHVMRCLVLADALNDNGINVEFICRNHKGNLVERIMPVYNALDTISRSIQWKTGKWQS